ncbi:MAG: hypothetical protein V8T46_07620 [Sutterella seckii]
MANNKSPSDILDENSTPESQGEKTDGFAYSQQHIQRYPNAHNEHIRKVAHFLFSRGIGYTKVSWITGVNINTLRDWGRSFKAGKFQPSYTPRQYDDDIKEKAVELRKAGLSLKDISVTIGCSTTAIRKWLLEAQEAGKIEKTVFSKVSRARLEQKKKDN